MRALIRVRGTHSRTPTLLLPAASPYLSLLACFLSFLPASSRFRQPPLSLTRSCETDHNRRKVKVGWGCPALPWLRSFWSPISVLRTRGSRGSFSSFLPESATLVVVSSKQMKSFFFSTPSALPPPPFSSSSPSPPPSLSSVP